MLTIVYYFEFYISVKKTRVWFSFLERRKYSSTNHYLVEKTPQQVAHPLLASWAADVDLMISLWLVDTNCFPDKSCLHHCFTVRLSGFCLVDHSAELASSTHAGCVVSLEYNFGMFLWAVSLWTMCIFQYCQLVWCFALFFRLALLVLVIAFHDVSIANGKPFLLFSSVKWKLCLAFGLHPN